MTGYIINSLLDTDLYKFTMQQVVFKKFPDVEVGYSFKNRTKGIDLKYDEIIDDFNEELKHLLSLSFTNDELKYLKSLGFFSRGYLEYLKNFKFNNDVYATKDKDGNLQITIIGTWLNTILFEVPVLAIVSELYCRNQGSSSHGMDGFNPLVKKINKFKEGCTNVGDYIKFADFGTRRRFSREWQDRVIAYLVKEVPKSFIGTSNVYFARKYNVKPIGTMAHEFIQAMQAMVRLSDSQKYAFQTWAEVYRGDLGIVLSDTLGKDTFFKDFDLYFAKLFDGARHDSGCPFEWGKQLIQHYRKFQIDPYTKTAVFSDGLNFEKIVALYKKFGSKIKCSFGIGTNLMNDCGIKPLQIVIKMATCDGQPVAKISDSPGKQMCEDPEYLKYLASQFNIPKERV